MLSNQTNRVYLDAYDADGLINVLGRQIETCGDTRQPYYIGAHLALVLLRNHRLDTQVDFMQLFETQLQKWIDGKDEV